MAAPTTLDSVMTLQNTAMLQIGKSLWEHRITHDAPINQHELFKPFPINEIPIPKNLRQTLNTCVKIMANNISKWIGFHASNIFFNRSYSNIVPCLKHLVWLVDGNIDYVETARKLLQDSSVSEFEKLTIAKEFFFKEFIDEKHPNLTDDQLREFFIARYTFKIMLNIAGTASGYYLIRIRERIAEFLRWYHKESVSDIKTFINNNTNTYPRDDFSTEDRYNIKTVLLILEHDGVNE